jgi:hypothetical protein
LISPPKQLPASAWSVLFTEEIKEKKTQQGKDFTGVASIAAAAATKYKNLSASEREVSIVLSILTPIDYCSSTTTISQIRTRPPMKLLIMTG